MAVNKVVMNTQNGEETLIDLTGDTVTPTTLAAGETAHDAAGNVIRGTMPTTAVLYTGQTLTEDQKAQARGNIGAMSQDDLRVDWNAAEGEPGHVLNRTHWTDIIGMEELPVTHTGNVAAWYVLAPIGLVVGKKYIVNWNGTDYQAIGLDVNALSGGQYPGAGIGNPAVLGGADNGLPFGIVDFGTDISGYGLYGVIGAVNSEADLDFTLYDAEVEIVHKLDKKYLPDGISTKAFYVTVQANGDGTGTPNKTYEEIYAAYEAGSPIIVALKLPAGDTLGIALVGYVDGMLFGTFVGIDEMQYLILFTSDGCTYGAAPISPVTSVNGQTGDVNLEIPKIPNSLKNPYALTINGTSYDGSKAVNIESIKGDTGEKGDKGDTGQRGTGLLAVTTGPSSYTTAVGGITPKYRMALSTIKTQSGATEVLLGDTVRYSYYHYPIAYLDASYAYFTTRVSIRGATGAAGKDGSDATVTAESIQNALGYIPTADVQPDWNAAESEPGHILNRTHWTEYDAETEIVHKLDKKYLPEDISILLDAVDTVETTIPSINLNDGVYEYGRFAAAGTEYNKDTPIEGAFRNVNYLPVEGGRTIVAYFDKAEWNNNNVGYPYQVVQYDADKNILVQRVEVLPYIATGGNSTLTLNANTAYIRMCFNRSGTAITTPLDEIKFAIYYLEDARPSFVSYEPTIVEEKVLNTASLSALRGRKIVYDGDSICEGRSGGTLDNGGGYAKIIADLTGCTAVNQAKGGARLCANSANHSVVNNLSNLPKDGDIYCFQGGINDFWGNTPIGECTTDYTGAVNTATICGALETIFRYVLNNFVGKAVCFVITHKVQNTATSANSNGDTFRDYRDAMIEVCEKYSIPYYDAFTQSGLNGWNAAQSNAYLTANSTGTGDGCHPNAEGYKRYYVPQLIQLFERITPVK